MMCTTRISQDDEDLNDSDDEHLTDDEHQKLQKLSRSVNAEGGHVEEEVRGWRILLAETNSCRCFDWSMAVQMCLHRLGHTRVNTMVLD